MEIVPGFSEVVVGPATVDFVAVVTAVLGVVSETATLGVADEVTAKGSVTVGVATLGFALTITEDRGGVVLGMVTLVTGSVLAVLSVGPIPAEGDREMLARVGELVSMTLETTREELIVDVGRLMGRLMGVALREGEITGKLVDMGELSVAVGIALGEGEIT